MRRFVLVPVLILGALSIQSCGAAGEASALTPRPQPMPVTVPVPEPTGTLEVHYIDVGTADATLLKGPDFTILIDAGLPGRNEVVPYLESAGVESLDLLIATHPHDDHIGQIPDVLQEFPVSEVWMSGGITAAQSFERTFRTLLRLIETDWGVDTSRAFRRTVEAIEASGATYREPRAGDASTVGSASIEVVHPKALTGDLNDDSLSVRITFGEIVFLFTGDAGIDAEHRMIARGHELPAHILQLGHHGSGAASSQEFLEQVRPEVAIYSSGKGGWLGNFFRGLFSAAKPNPEVLDRLAAMDVSVYGTRVHGTIMVITDGVTYEVIPERET